MHDEDMEKKLQEQHKKKKTERKRRRDIVIKRLMDGSLPFRYSPNEQ